MSLSISAKELHENKSQGVLYEFQQGARIWTERQRRWFVVGGPLDGKMKTRYELSLETYGSMYEEYHSTMRGMTHTMIWAFTNR